MTLCDLNSTSQAKTNRLRDGQPESSGRARVLLFKGGYFDCDAIRDTRVTEYREPRLEI